MTKRPILFSAPMVRAILEGRKTQTRRVIKKQPILGLGFHIGWAGPRFHGHNGGFWSVFKEVINIAGQKCHVWQSNTNLKCPYGQPGDRLYVKETWRGGDDTLESVFYKADIKDTDPLYMHMDTTWRPSIHMPRKFSRITLEITDVRVERVKDISEADAIAEGAKSVCDFSLLWDSINAARGFGWNSNPWVWAITFKKIEGGEK